MITETVTFDEFMEWEPCWLDDDGVDDCSGMERIEEFAGAKETWSLQDLQALHGKIGDADWIWLIQMFLIHLDENSEYGANYMAEIYAQLPGGLRGYDALIVDPETTIKLFKGLK